MAVGMIVDRTIGRKSLGLELHIVVKQQPDTFPAVSVLLSGLEQQFLFPVLIALHRQVSRDLFRPSFPLLIIQI